MISRETEWVWDSWYAIDGGVLHAFYLMAPKSLGNPDLRHVNARVGHSISSDGINWEHLPEALGPQDSESFDNQAIWTGSIVHTDGQWHMFFTGINRITREKVQALGHAVSPDLLTWTRVAPEPLLKAAPPYALYGNGYDGAEHFRDPWVFHHDNEWHMLFTASDEEGWGTVGHATSPDLNSWTLKDPLVTSSGLRQLEVNETLQIDGEWFLFFCTGPRDVERPGIEKTFGTYYAPAAGPLGPFDLDRAAVLKSGIYAGRVIEFDGKVFLLGFQDSGEPGAFSGQICDPLYLKRTGPGKLEIVS